MSLGFWGELSINVAFVSAVLAAIGYFWAAQKNSSLFSKYATWFYGIKGVFVAAASVVLIYLLVNHQFQYFYVFNYTSKDLALKYLISAYYGGQEGSFLLWILISSIVGLGLAKWTREPYRSPVLFVMALTQVFLLSMIVGIPFGDITVGASPFRTIAEEMPNAPFLQSNPDFVPADGSGLNDLLKSPWMMIHPPILFVGFSMMTVPFAFAIAALWKRKYQEWVTPALPWTLGANLCLLTAIFLGGYWAYVTLSFGGYWAWDPVENASLIPWLFGTAGIHTMVIQRKSSTSQKSSIIFAILSYLAVIYETFLTRSGILADASVHSFVDLGLYNQLLIFMLLMVFFGVGLFIYRYRELPTQNNKTNFLSREFMTFSGAMLLFLLALIILIGTSSPILGRLFVESPTPPEISFYNEWSMPLAIVMAIFTVLGQYLYWTRHDAESLSSDLLLPLTLTSITTLFTIIVGDVRDIYYMVYIFAAYFALIGNGIIIYWLTRKNPKLAGGSLSHVGFALLMLGIIASSLYDKPLLDADAQAYNRAIEQGKVTDENGFPVTQKLEMLELKLNKPVRVNDEYLFTYEGYALENQDRPGQQTYRIRVEEIDSGRSFYMNPEMYPMLTSSTADNIQWSVDPDVSTGILSDIFMYVAGSSYTEYKNKQVRRGAQIQPAASGDRQNGNRTINDDPGQNIVKMKQGEEKNLGNYILVFKNYVQADTADLPENSIVGVRAHLQVTDKSTGETESAHPLFAVVQNENETVKYAAPAQIEKWGIILQFMDINPATGEVDITVNGLDQPIPEEQWVFLVAEEKPFISVVWLGTFVLMGGFSVSIIRRWSDQKKREKKLSKS